MLQFSSITYEDALGEMTYIMFVKLYHNRFEELANWTQDLSESFLVSCFVSGLEDEVEVGVRMFHLNSMTQEIGLKQQ